MGLITSSSHACPVNPAEHAQYGGSSSVHVLLFWQSKIAVGHGHPRITRNRLNWNCSSSSRPLYVTPEVHPETLSDVVIKVPIWGYIAMFRHYTWLRAQTVRVKTMITCKRLFSFTGSDILLVMIGALKTMTKNVQDNLEKLKIGSNVGDLQKIGWLGTSTTLRKVLDSQPAIQILREVE